MIFSKTKNYKNYKKNVFVFLFLLCFFSFFSAFKVDAARRMEAMAFITDKNGQPIDGEYSVRFAIYSTDRAITDSYPSDSDSGSRLWEESQIINIKKGILQFTLGQKQELPIFGNIQDGQFYLGIRINQDGEMVPRKRITPSLFAYDAINATLLNGKKIGVESGNIVALNDANWWELSQSLCEVEIVL
jgi:hypothetical protein